MPTAAAKSSISTMFLPNVSILRNNESKAANQKNPPNTMHESVKEISFREATTNGAITGANLCPNMQIPKPNVLVSVGWTSGVYKYNIAMGNIAKHAMKKPMQYTYAEESTGMPIIAVSNPVENNPNRNRVNLPKYEVKLYNTRVPNIAPKLNTIAILYAASASCESNLPTSNGKKPKMPHEKLWKNHTNSRGRVLFQLCLSLLKENA